MTSRAKTGLLTRMKSIELASRLEALIDRDVMQVEHNETANLLRKGLGIVAFNILEDFIKSRTAEMFDSISNSRVRFDNLPEKLKIAATSGALKALSYQSNLERKNDGDWLSLIHSEAKNIFSTSQFPFTLSPISMLYENSNVSHVDISDVMKSLDIIGGWNKLKEVSDLIGGGVVDLQSAYINMYKRRNHCAHEASFIYEYTWLENAINEIIAIAAAFDIVISTRCRYIINDPTAAFSSHNTKPNPGIRFLVEEGQKFNEKTSLTSRNVKKWDSLDDAYDVVIPRCSQRNEFLITINRQRRISDWNY